MSRAPIPQRRSQSYTDICRKGLQRQVWQYDEERNLFKCLHFLGFISTGLLASNADQVVKTIKICFSIYIFQLKQLMVMGSWDTMDNWRFSFVIIAIFIQVFNLFYDDLHPTWSFCQVTNMLCQLFLHINSRGNVSKSFTNPSNLLLNTACLLLSATVTVLNVFIDAFDS